MWRDDISAAFRDAKYAAPADAAALDRGESALGVVFPEELCALLLESNGVAADYGSPIVWPVEEIVAQNRAFRQNADFAELYMPFDALLFIGAAGNGDQFGYRILGGRIRPTSWIFRWDHESDDRVWFANDLKQYFRKLIPEE